MKITALKAQIKNADRVSVFVDGKYSFSVTLQDVIEYGIKKDTELSEADVATYKKISSDGKTKARTFEWLLSRPRSTKELQQYLYKKKVEPDLSQKLIQEFTDKKVVNDERYAQWATERLVRKHKSSRAIASELKSKGIPQTAHIGHDLTVPNDLEAIKHTVQKVAGRTRYKDQQKLIAYLLSKGFMYADVKTVLSIQESEQSS